jgi:hypothetical protein
MVPNTGQWPAVPAWASSQRLDSRLAVWANHRVSRVRGETEATVARLASTMEVAAYADTFA